MKIGFPFGLNIFIWSIISFIRAIYERFRPQNLFISTAVLKSKVKKVAVCLPAHNEEAVIAQSIRSIIKLLPAKQVFVVSDGSTDRTSTIAKKHGCKVLDLQPGMGKALALNTLINTYQLLDRFEFIVFVDADTLLDEEYLNRALALFSKHPKVAALAAYAVPIWERKFQLSLASFISAYRTKLYQILQMFIMYGQTWQYANVNPVVPGFASMYRTRILRHLDLATPGIWIEDFNLAFQIHKNRLGRIGHDPRIRAYYHDPRNFRDYIHQVSRWNVGFYQTVRLQGIWPSLFWLTTGLFSLEMLLNAAITVGLPLTTIGYGMTKLLPGIFFPETSLWQLVLNNLLAFWWLIAGMALTDYALTVFIALRDRRPLLLLFGLGFFLFHILNSVILLTSFPKGLLISSEGKWDHAKR